MKPGDRVLWLHSPRRSFLSGWRVQRVPGVIVRVCRRCLRIRVFVGGKEKVVNLNPENVILVENLRY
jgi:ribosomal protein L21E